MTRVYLYGLFAAVLTLTAVSFNRHGESTLAALLGALALWTAGAMLWTHDRVERGRPRGAAWTLALCLVVFAVLLGWCGHRLVHGPGEFRVTVRVERIDGRCR